MEDMFYIVCKIPEDDWWQLRLKDSHIVIACGEGKEYILNCLATLVKRYKSTFNFRCAIQSMEKFPYSQEDMKVFKREYEEQAHLYEKEVVDTINTAFSEVTSKKLKKKTTKIITPRVKPLIKKTAKEEVAATKEIEEEVVRRPLTPKKKLLNKKLPLLKRK